MKEYPKIQTVYLRDPDNKYKTLLRRQYADPAFEYLADCEWVWTEKIDGTNIRVIWDAYRITFAGKTNNASIPGFLVTALQRRFLTEEMRHKLAEIFPEGGCLYGEGYGAKIQKGGGRYRSDQDFVLFDVRVGHWWLRRESIENIAVALGLDVVPIIGRGTLPEMVRFAEFKPMSILGGEYFPAEGIVARPAIELCTRSGQRIITKIKHKDFG